MGLVIFLVVLGLLMAVAVMAYNRLVALGQRSEEAWSDVDVQLKRRTDLVPNLVETVKGYADHERGTFEDVVRARGAAVNAETPEARARAEGQLTDALRHLFALAESYPELKANENFQSLQQSLGKIENDIQSARRYYNAVVRDLNTVVDSSRPTRSPCSSGSSSAGTSSSTVPKTARCPRSPSRAAHRRSGCPPAKPASVAGFWALLRSSSPSWRGRRRRGRRGAHSPSIASPSASRFIPTRASTFGRRSPSTFGAAIRVCIASSGPVSARGIRVRAAAGRRPGARRAVPPPQDGRVLLGALRADQGVGPGRGQHDQDGHRRLPRASRALQRRRSRGAVLERHRGRVGRAHPPGRSGGHGPPAAVPGEAGAIAYTGSRGIAGTDYVEQREGNVLTFRTTRPLRPREGLTIAVAWPPGVVGRPPAWRAAAWFLQDNWPLGLPLLALALGLFAWRAYGRDPAADRLDQSPSTGLRTTWRRRRQACW